MHDDADLTWRKASLRWNFSTRFHEIGHERSSVPIMCRRRGHAKQDGGKRFTVTAEQNERLKWSPLCRLGQSLSHAWLFH
jgi:hypothetical protein